MNPGLTQILRLLFQRQVAVANRDYSLQEGLGTSGIARASGISASGRGATKIQFNSYVLVDESFVE